MKKHTLCLCLFGSMGLSLVAACNVDGQQKLEKELVNQSCDYANGLYKLSSISMLLQDGSTLEYGNDNMPQSAKEASVVMEVFGSGEDKEFNTYGFSKDESVGKDEHSELSLKSCIEDRNLQQVTVASSTTGNFVEVQYLNKYSSKARNEASKVTLHLQRVGDAEGVALLQVHGEVPESVKEAQRQATATESLAAKRRECQARAPLQAPEWYREATIEDDAIEGYIRDLPNYKEVASTLVSTMTYTSFGGDLLDKSAPADLRNKFASINVDCSKFDPNTGTCDFKFSVLYNFRHGSSRSAQAIQTVFTGKIKKDRVDKANFGSCGDDYEILDNKTTSGQGYGY